MYNSNTLLKKSLCSVEYFYLYSLLLNEFPVKLLYIFACLNAKSSCVRDPSFYILQVSLKNGYLRVAEYGLGIEKCIRFDFRRLFLL